MISRQTRNVCITFVQCCPTSKTLDRRCTNVLQMFCVCWVGRGILPYNLRHRNMCDNRVTIVKLPLFIFIPSKQDVRLMLGQSPRRWATIKPLLGQQLHQVFIGRCMFVEHVSYWEPEKNVAISEKNYNVMIKDLKVYVYFPGVL